MHLSLGVAAEVVERGTAEVGIASWRLDVVVEKLHEDEITVQVDDYAAAENLVKAYSTVGHAHHSIMSAMKGNKLGLKFEKKAIPVTSKEEEQKYGTLVTVTSVGLDMTFVRKLTNFIISSL
ncbi:uncharacterized protein LOC142575553 isoform X7 [Dermacentor variabilis]|uniref:uncharacterized protein LOC142575553 isoform X7 n=1 Tax=Dermacentor variabilis TaxID=34621 RepID=UPI003F5C0951